MSDRRVPLILPCRGTGEGGSAAADVAQTLERRGLVRVADDVEQVTAAAREGREVLALDGCATRCQARLLDAHGVQPLRSLDLAESASAIAGASSVADLAAAATPVRRARRPPAVPPGPSERRNHSLDEYLLAVAALTAPVAACGTVVDAATVSAHIAQHLQVTRPTAGEMVGRLEHEGLVRRGVHKDVLLTAAGRARADRLLRRQRILECFAVDTLGYTLAECHEQARRLAGGVDDELVERMWSVLGRPERCPHGCPIDADEARRTAQVLHALSTVPDGTAVRVDRLGGDSPDSVRALVAAGVRPGAVLSDVSQDREAATVSFTTTGERRAVSSVLGATVLVR